MVNPLVVRYLAESASPQAQALADYLLQDRGDGQGPRLIVWNAAKLGPQPTAQQLADAEASAAYQSWLAQHGGDPLQTTRAQALQLLGLTDPKHPLAPVVWAVRAGLYQIQDSLNALRPSKVDKNTGKQEIAAKVQSGEADS